MAEMHINSVNTTFRITDSNALLSQPVLDQIVRAVMERMQAEKASQQRADADRRLRSGVSCLSLGNDWK